MLFEVDSRTWGAFSIASAVVVLIYALVSVSGANFNPAATFALHLAGVLDHKTAVAYVHHRASTESPTAGVGVEDFVKAAQCRLCE